MDQDKKIPKPLLARLQEHFDQLVPRNLFLVKPDTQLGRVYRTAGSTAVKNNITIAFRITLDTDYTCDYFLNADGYTEHRRYFFATDEVELLENYEGQIGGQGYEDEDMDYEEHMLSLIHISEPTRPY